jgi:membrane-associated phospholipid phosphatase
MDTLLNWGIEIIVWLQQASPALDGLFRVFTHLGDEPFFLVFLPIIIWCVDYNRGLRLTVLFLFSAYLNSFAKVLAGQPRPFEFDPRAKKLVEAGGFGLPSGHTQSTVTIWGFIAARFKNRLTLILATVLIIMIPLSRIYLGVHFPTDVIGGYILGFIILFLFLKLESPIINWLKNQGLLVQLALAIILPTLLMLIFPGSVMDSIPTCATLMGATIGLALSNKWIELDTDGAWWKRVLRYLVGMIIVSLFYFGLKVVFKNLEPAAAYRFVRYTLVGFSIVFLAPWVFTKIKL